MYFINVQGRDDLMWAMDFSTGKKVLQPNISPSFPAVFNHPARCFPTSFSNFRTANIAHNFDPLCIKK
jgi:hypothetical protein